MTLKYLKLATAAAVIAAFIPAAAIAANHDTEGTPGDPNCEGQTMAYLNELGKGADVHGIGNIADAFGLSVKDLKAAIDEFCNP